MSTLYVMVNMLLRTYYNVPHISEAKLTLLRTFCYPVYVLLRCGGITQNQVYINCMMHIIMYFHCCYHSLTIIVSCLWNTMYQLVKL